MTGTKTGTTNGGFFYVRTTQAFVIEWMCGIYHFRKMVPLALRNCYNRREIKISLKTGDLTLATRRAQVYALRYDAEFQCLRRKMEDDIFKKAGVNPLHVKSFEIEDIEVQNGKISISGLKMDPQ